MGLATVTALFNVTVVVEWAAASCPTEEKLLVLSVDDMVAAWEHHLYKDTSDDTKAQVMSHDVSKGNIIHWYFKIIYSLTVENIML